jgi:6-phosphogluconolactonase (cycloisomerase 2 family)
VIGYAYALSYSSADNFPAVSTISQYLIAPTGLLTPMSTPTVTGGLSKPQSITVDPLGKYAYLAGGCAPSSKGVVSLYTIGAGGALTRVTENFVEGCYVAFDPSGKHSYVGNFSWGGLDAAISQYVVNSDGTFTSMSTPTVAVIGDAGPMTIDPTGKYAYMVNQNQGTASQYMIGVTGALTPMSPATVATGLGTGLSLPQSITVHPTGKYLYVANWGDSTVSQYTISQDGTLMPMSPATVSAGSGPSSITIDPKGKYLYVANCCNTAISQYSIKLDGTLTPMLPATISTGYGTGSISIDPTGKYVYLTGAVDGVVSQYMIGPIGSLTPLNPPTVLAGMGTSSVVTTGMH